MPRTDLARGLGALVTVPVSRAAATQRAGRAGREAPGCVYRCWSAATHERLPAQPEPEIATADLTGFALELAGLGATRTAPGSPCPTRRRRPRWRSPGRPSPPSARSTRTAGSPPGAGRSPPSARTRGWPGRCSTGPARVGADRAAEVVALLAEETVAGPGDDLVAAWRRLRAGADPAATARWRAEVRRLRGRPARGDADRRRSAAARTLGRLPDDLAAGLLVGLAYPERLARARRPGGSAYLMAGGTAAELAPGSGLAGAGWLAVAVADRSPGAPAARIRLGRAARRGDRPGGGAARCCAPSGRSAGPTATWWPGRWSGSARSSCVERPLDRPDPDAGRRRRC